MQDICDIPSSAAALAGIDALIDDDIDCMAEEDWIVVGRKGRHVREAGSNRDDDQSSSLQSSVTEHTLAGAFPRNTVSSPPTPSHDTLLTSVENAYNDIRTSRFYSNCMTALHTVQSCLQQQLTPEWALHNIHSLVVYGLGSLSGYQGLNSRYQLAFSLLLRQCLEGLAAPPEAYDPVFTAQDCHLLQELDVCVIGHNERGRRVVQQPTLFYLPHCEAELTDALLEANWTESQLRNVIIIGNSFAKYADRWSLPVAAHSGLYRPTRMLALVNAPKNCMIEVAMHDAGFPVPAAFNDLSIHVFPQWHASLDAW